MPAKATLQDVATRAGVHRTTVSLALRDHPRIPAATRARVKENFGALAVEKTPAMNAALDRAFPPPSRPQPLEML